MRAEVCASWLALVVLAGTSHILAAGGAVDEYAVKAAFLLNFAKFVEWPADAFKSAEDPVAICVLGQNPFGSALDDVIRDKTVANRRFAVREVSSAQQAGKCHIVFISASERKRFRSFLDELKGRPILTVGESEEFTPSGGIISLRLIDSRVRIEIDVGAAERAKLRISSKLLSLAEIRK
jgi:hypothetical protein